MSNAQRAVRKPLVPIHRESVFLTNTTRIQCKLGRRAGRFISFRFLYYMFGMGSLLILVREQIASVYVALTNMNSERLVRFVHVYANCEKLVNSLILINYIANYKPPPKFYKLLCRFIYEVRQIDRQYIETMMETLHRIDRVYVPCNFKIILFLFLESERKKKDLLKKKKLIKIDGFIIKIVPTEKYVLKKQCFTFNFQ